MKYLVEVTYIKEVEAKDGHEASSHILKELPMNIPDEFEQNVESTAIHD